MNARIIKGIITAIAMGPAVTLVYAVTVNQPPAHPAYKGSDETQRVIRVYTERVIAESRADLSVNDLPIEPSSAKRTTKRVSRSTPIAHMKRECRLESLTQGGSPTSPFVAVCESVKS